MSAARPRPSRWTPLILALAALVPAWAWASGKPEVKSTSPKLESKGGPSGALSPLEEARQRLRMAVARKQAERTGKDLPMESSQGETEVVAKPDRPMLHPFFQTHAADPLGKIALLSAPDPDQQQPPRCIVHMAEGMLFWLTEQSRINGLTPYHGHHVIPVDNCKALHALALDEKGGLCFFGDGRYGRILFPGGSNPPDGIFQMNRKFCSSESLAMAGAKSVTDSKAKDAKDHPRWEIPRMVVTGSDGELLGASDQHFFTFRPELDGVWGMWPRWKDQPSILVWDAGKRLLCGALPNLSELFCVDYSGPKIERKLLQDGARPVGGALGKDGRVWFSLAGRNELLALDARSGKGTYYPLAKDGTPCLGAHGIIQGPDGHLWIALTGYRGFARVKCDGEVRLFPEQEEEKASAWAGPDPAERPAPMDLFPGRDGRFYFNIHGSTQIGAFTVEGRDMPEAKNEYVSRIPGGDAERGDGKAEPAPKPLSRNAKKKLKRRQKAKGEGKADVGPGAVAGDPDDAGLEEASGEAGGDHMALAETDDGAAAAEHKVPEAGAGAGVALCDLEVAPSIFLDADQVRHIRDQHGFSVGVNGKSQFAEAFSSHEAIQKLVQEAAKANWDLNQIYDARGARLIYHRRNDVGWYWHYDEKVPTDRYKVVIRWRQDFGSGEWYQTVRSAYPVSNYD